MKWYLTVTLLFFLWFVFASLLKGDKITLFDMIESVFYAFIWPIFWILLIMFVTAIIFNKCKIGLQNSKNIVLWKAQVGS